MESALESGLHDRQASTLIFASIPRTEIPVGSRIVPLSYYAPILSIGQPPISLGLRS